jgi:hypothetical protein
MGPQLVNEKDWRTIGEAGPGDGMIRVMDRSLADGLISGWRPDPKETHVTVKIEELNRRTVHLPIDGIDIPDTAWRNTSAKHSYQGPVYCTPGVVGSKGPEGMRLSATPRDGAVPVRVLRIPASSKLYDMPLDGPGGKPLGPIRANIYALTAEGKIDEQTPVRILAKGYEVAAQPGYQLSVMTAVIQVPDGWEGTLAVTRPYISKNADRKDKDGTPGKLLFETPAYIIHVSGKGAWKVKQIDGLKQIKADAKNDGTVKRKGPVPESEWRRSTPASSTAAPSPDASNGTDDLPQPPNPEVWRDI